MNLLSVRREVGEFKERYKWMALCVVLALLGIVARLVHLQIIEREHWVAEAQRNILKRVRLPATRGLIRDAKGNPVASNRPSFDLYVTPQLLGPEPIEKLARLMGLDADKKADLKRRVADVPERRRSHLVELYRDITRDQFASLETHKQELAGLVLVARPVRKYPYGSLAAHAIGFLNEVSGEDLARFPDRNYKSGDLIGRGGVEAAWENYLHGQDGELTMAVDVSGRSYELAGAEPHSTEVRREPIPGRDLRLTLDMDLMKFLERSFRPYASGAAVVVDVHTGRVRALFSKPSYDLNEMSGRLTAKRQSELRESPYRPMIDKSVYDTYFPGSTFKPVSALAALRDAIVPRATRVDCGGYYQLGNRRFRCTHSHGSVDMRRAIIQSCNVYFYRLAEQVGLDKIAELAQEFGLGSVTGIGINTESPGVVPTREWYAKGAEPYRVGFTLNTAIGQGDTRVTVLQLAMAYAALANGGSLYVPQLVQSVESPNGQVIEEFAPRLRRKLAIEPEHLAFVVDGLIGVVNDPKGTAYAARLEDGVTVAGKTGTAQVNSAKAGSPEEDPRGGYFQRTHAWFAGFAPAEDPQLAIVVLVEHGGHGGTEAAPIAVRVLNEALGSHEPVVALPAPGGRSSKGAPRARTGRDAPRAQSLVRR
jgi:penicillin-binding protein 2